MSVVARDGGHSWKRALLTGLAIAAGPILGLNVLLAIDIATTSQQDVDGVASELLKVVETRLDDAAATLISLGLKNVSDCEPGTRELLDAALHRARYITELAVVDASGVGRCSAFGEPRVVRQLSPGHGTIRPDIVISTVGIGETGAEQLIQLHWRYPNGEGLRVLLPGRDLLPEFLRSHASAAFIADITMIDGAVVARETLDSTPTVAEPSIIPTVSASAPSQRYPLKIDVEIPGSAMARANEGIFLYANLCSLVFAFVVAGVAVMVNRWSGGPARQISDGIRRGEFVPYYQPVIDLVSGKLKGCEVLVRWRKPDGRILPPGGFISLAEASGEIFPLTIALMEAARDDLETFYGARPSLKIGFNLVAGHFDDDRIVHDVRRIFEGSAVQMTQLMFEVTERQPLQDIKGARLIIAKLQALGARVALDDVGTGHGGLSYLLKLGVDVMKIDKMFVDAIGTDRYSVPIIDSLVKLANDMNLDLIAEGVETFEQVQYLREKGVRMAQGYVFAPPLPATSFLALVEAMAPVRREDRALRTAGVPMT